MIKVALRNDSLSEAQLKFWYQCFKLGLESVESDPHTERPLTNRKLYNKFK